MGRLAAAARLDLDGEDDEALDEGLCSSRLLSGLGVVIERPDDGAGTSRKSPDFACLTGNLLTYPFQEVCDAYVRV